MNMGSRTNHTTAIAPSTPMKIQVLRRWDLRLEFMVVSHSGEHMSLSTLTDLPQTTQCRWDGTEDDHSEPDVFSFGIARLLYRFWRGRASSARGQMQEATESVWDAMIAINRIE